MHIHEYIHGHTFTKRQFRNTDLLGDIAALVPDHCNKMNNSMSESHKFFGSPEQIKAMFILYCSLLSVQ